jgi:uncharacterized protein YndB with AHSA1/START domain
MAVTEIDVAAPPERVFEVLADAKSYEHWVVGAKEIRGADPGFPDPGTRLHHTIGVGPLALEDTTEVIGLERPRRLLLEAHLGPVGSMRIALDLEPRAGGTHVVMTEEPVEGIPAQLLHKLGRPLLRGRNYLSLEQLKELAEARV